MIIADTLKTHSCYHGGNTTFDIGHIVMEEDEDIFSYLSEEFLNDERIRIVDLMLYNEYQCKPNEASEKIENIENWRIF